MAEILISLTIIGIIAAITLPSLQANINEKTWATQRKALYSRMSQAISMMDSLNGYGVVLNNDGTMNENETASKTALAFISDGLSKVLKIQNICDGSTTEGLKKCGFPDEIGLFSNVNNKTKTNTPKNISQLNKLFTTRVEYNNGTIVDYSQINTNAAAFETANGESIVVYYNPNCSYTYASGITVSGENYSTLLQPTMCANFIFDLNGRKGPNKYGKDIGFMTAFYPTDTEFVASLFRGYIGLSKSEEITVGNANATCKATYGNDVRVANKEELKSIFIHAKMLGFPRAEDTIYSSTPSKNNKYYAVGMYAGNIIGNNNLGRGFYCVK